jgi:hypothetical protein
MEVPDREEPEEFLKPSELCDSNHPLVKATAAKVTEKAETLKDAAVKIFCFVRDKTAYATVHPWKMMFTYRGKTIPSDIGAFASIEEEAKAR